MFYQTGINLRHSAVHLGSASLFGVWMPVALLPDLNQHVIPACLLYMCVHSPSPCADEHSTHPPSPEVFEGRGRFDALWLWTALVKCSLVELTVDELDTESGWAAAWTALIAACCRWSSVTGLSRRADVTYFCDLLASANAASCLRCVDLFHFLI